MVAKKPKKITVTKAKKKAWSAFSLYIRIKYANAQGYANCYTCGLQKHYKELQAGHGIGGRNNAVLFLEKVVRPQCVGCNMFGRGKYAIFTRKLINELGIEEYDRLVTESNKTVQYKVFDYLEKAEYYKQKYEEKLGSL